LYYSVTRKEDNHGGEAIAFVGEIDLLSEYIGMTDCWMKTPEAEEEPLA
jgi:hypothetical protein